MHLKKTQEYSFGQTTLEHCDLLVCPWDRCCVACPSFGKAVRQMASYVTLEYRAATTEEIMLHSLTAEEHYGKVKAHCERLN